MWDSCADLGGDVRTNRITVPHSPRSPPPSVVVVQASPSIPSAHVHQPRFCNEDVRGLHAYPLARWECSISHYLGNHRSLSMSSIVDTRPEHLSGESICLEYRKILLKALQVGYRICGRQLYVQCDVQGLHRCGSEQSELHSVELPVCCFCSCSQ